MDIISDYMKNKGKISHKNQPYVDSLVNNIVDNFEYSPSYFQISKMYDTKIYDTWILDEKAYKDDNSKKKIIMKPSQPLNRGDIIFWNNQHWLVTKLDVQTVYYNNGLIEYCNNEFIFKWNGINIDIPCVFMESSAKNSLILKDNQYIQYPASIFIIIVPYNSDTLKVPLNSRVIVNDVAYKIIAWDNASFVDKATQTGVIHFKLVSGEKRPQDDIVNGVADNSHLNIPTTPTLPTNPLNINGSTSIILSTTQNYSISDNTKSIVWSLTDLNGNATTLGSLINVTNNCCSIKVGNVKGSIKLKATDSKDSTQFTELNIIIKSAF